MQDHLADYDDGYSSGSGEGGEGAETQSLAEILATNSPVAKRSGIPHPLTTIPPAKIVKLRNMIALAKRLGKPVRTRSGRMAIPQPPVSKPVDSTSEIKSRVPTRQLANPRFVVNNTNTINIINSTDLTSVNSIDPDLARIIAERRHFLPTLGMPLRCRVSGKNTFMNGELKFLGHLRNVPRKGSVAVAGIQLDNAENLGTDGTFMGKRYFIAPPKRGYFVPIRNCAAK